LGRVEGRENTIKIYCVKMFNYKNKKRPHCLKLRSTFIEEKERGERRVKGEQGGIGDLLCGDWEEGQHLKRK
jgi:hypothetical protein